MPSMTERRVGLRFGFFLLLTLMGLAGCGGGGHTSAPPVPSPTPTPSPAPTVPAADHVFLVVLENHSFSEVIGNPAMPYLNALAAAHSLAGNYFANAHHSIADYFMLTTGQVESTDNNFTGTVADDNVVRAISGAGKSWKAYMESLPAAGYTGNDV